MSSNGPKMYRPPRKTSETGFGPEFGGPELAGSEVADWLVVDPVHADKTTMMIATTRDRFDPELVVTISCLILSFRGSTKLLLLARRFVWTPT